MEQKSPKAEALTQVKAFLNDRMANRLRPKVVETAAEEKKEGTEIHKAPEGDGFSEEEKEMLKKARC